MDGIQNIKTLVESGNISVGIIGLGYVGLPTAIGFLDAGFKKNKEYNTDDLPASNSAYFGFMKNNLGEPKDYEIRFYSTHMDAVQQGKKYADNIVGVDGCVSKDCALWKEDLKHRVMLAELGVASFHAGSGKVIPKYYNYVIYGNMILLCPGYNDEDAMDRCLQVIHKLEESK